MTEEERPSGASGWRFNFGKVQNFRVLPRAQPLHESSSDADDIPQDSLTRAVPRYSSPGLRMSTHARASENFSTFSFTKPRPLGDTTIESLQLESQQIALREASERSEETKRTRDQLEDDYRRLKADNQRRLADFRQRVERNSEKLERATGLLRSQVKEKKNELASAQAKLEADGRFKEIRDREQRIQRTLKSFVDCQETIAALANLLQFSPLADSEFDVIAETGAFQSPMGQAVAGFIAASKKVLVKKQDEV
jgi:hypothetical protein